MMPMFFVDKFRPRPRRAVLQRPRCALVPRAPGYSDGVTPEQLQQLLLLADCLVRGGEKTGQRKPSDESASSRRGNESDSGRVTKQQRRRHRRFCPYHCVRAEKEEENGDVQQDSVAVSERQTAVETRSDDQKWETTLDCSAFKPTELKVQVDGDSVRVHALHDERSGGNRTTFEMRRVIQLPDDVRKEDVECVFVADSGQLMLTAPRSTPENPPSVPSSSADGGHPLTHASEKQAPDSTADTSADAPTSSPAKAEGKRKCQDTGEADRETEQKRRKTDEAECKECSASCQETEGVKTETSARAAASTDTHEETPPADTGNDKESETPTPNSTDPDSVGDAHTTITQTQEDTSASPKDTDTTADVTNCVPEKTQPAEAVAPACDRDFSLTFHVDKFTPQDLDVKVVGNIMTLRGEREVKEDGFSGVERMERKVTLPDSVDPDRLKCVFTNDGRLVVSAA